MRIRVAVAIAAVVMLAGACSTVPSSGGDGMTGGQLPGIVEIINSASPTELAERSSVPFLFDAELVVRRGDVELMWSGLRDSDFRIEGGSIAIEQARSGDYMLVADTFDMETFFAPGGVVPDSAQWLVADSTLGSVRILLADGTGPDAVILGLARFRNE